MRCSFVNLNNPKYIDYHDREWGKISHDDKYLYEILILETFQSGLSWEVVLNKREAFRKALDDFNYEKIINYDRDKLNELYNDSNIIRSKGKINSIIANTRVFMNIQKEYGSFGAYLWSYTNNKVIDNNGKLLTRSALSDKIAFDLKLRGMKYIGSTTIYSYLQAVGVINDHEINCDYR